MKLFLLPLLFISALAYTQAQLNVDVSAGAKSLLGFFDFTTFLQPIADEILALPNVSADIELRVENALADARVGFANSRNIFDILRQLSISKSELRNIRKDAIQSQTTPSTEPTTLAP